MQLDVLFLIIGAKLSGHDGSIAIKEKLDYGSGFKKKQKSMNLQN